VVGAIRARSRVAVGLLGFASAPAASPAPTASAAWITARLKRSPLDSVRGDGSIVEPSRSIGDRRALGCVGGLRRGSPRHFARKSLERLDRLRFLVEWFFQIARVFAWCDRFVRERRLVGGDGLDRRRGDLRGCASRGFLASGRFLGALDTATLAPALGIS